MATEIRSIGGNTELVLTMKTALNMTGYGTSMKTHGTTPVLACLQESTYVYVEDNSGCIVGDTVEIADQARDTYYVSTTGSNSNTGTSATDAFASIATAVDYACTNDTIILLDGTYYEDSLEIKKNLVIGSQYLFDNDTNHIAATVIDGENRRLDYALGIWSSWSDTATNQLVGLTIQNGNSTNSSYAGGLK